ncbi:MAG: hypothetical protein J6R29_03345 [Clostridia bacterium]|nr:hypothetical protein [Clostridia bacterium]
MAKIAEQKVENLNLTTINELTKLTNENQNIGVPIKCEDGSLIIPVSKTLVGYLSGGGEYGEVKLFDRNKNKPFLGGGGAVVNFQPVGFLYIKNGICSFIKIPNEPFEKLFDSALNLFNGAVNVEK